MQQSAEILAATGHQTRCQTTFRLPSSFRFRMTHDISLDVYKRPVAAPKSMSLIRRVPTKQSTLPKRSAQRYCSLIIEAAGRRKGAVGSRLAVLRE